MVEFGALGIAGLEICEQIEDGGFCLEPFRLPHPIANILSIVLTKTIVDLDAEVIDSEASSGTDVFGQNRVKAVANELVPNRRVFDALVQSE